MGNDAPRAGEPIEINSCDDVLSHVFEFLDHETDDSRRAVIAEHLEDCSSCLREFGIEAEFKALVRRRCGGDAPPSGLRDRIKLQLTTVSFEDDGTQVSVQRVSSELVTDAEERPTTAGADWGRAFRAHRRPVPAGVGPLARGGAGLLAGAPLASTLGHRCPPLAVPVGLI